MGSTGAKMASTTQKLTRKRPTMAVGERKMRTISLRVSDCLGFTAPAAGISTDIS